MPWAVESPSTTHSGPLPAAVAAAAPGARAAAFDASHARA